MPCLLGLLRECETPMAKPVLKVTEETRFVVFSRAGYRCERCFTKLAGVFGASVHHRRPRMMGGSRKPELHYPANLIVLCGSGNTGCHGWVESNRDRSREHGYLINKVESASSIPFRDNAGIWYLIDNEGLKKRFDTNGTNHDI